MERWRRPDSRKPASVLVVAAIVVAGGVFGVVPVRSQALRLDARPVDAVVPVGDPWDAIWDGVPAQRVPLSAQNVAPPFGGGTVASLEVRALYDAERLYVNVEWSDGDVDDSVNAAAAFSDAVALQFPSTEAEDLPPFTMGAADLPVNIWQWKAVWQADLDSGFATGADRFPNTAVDGYPGGDDPLYQPARSVGNPLAEADHASPVENLIAAGFGSLTSAAAQDVDGAGAWRDGTWRALFARDLTSPGEGHAEFAVGEDTFVAFAVWDGGESDRNGQKSIAEFVELHLAEEMAAVVPGLPGAAGRDGPPSPWMFATAVLTAFAAVAVIAELAMRPRRSKG